MSRHFADEMAQMPLGLGARGRRIHGPSPDLFSPIQDLRQEGQEEEAVFRFFIRICMSPWTSSTWARRNSLCLRIMRWRKRASIPAVSLRTFSRLRTKAGRRVRAGDVAQKVQIGWGGTPSPRRLF